LCGVEGAIALTFSVVGLGLANGFGWEDDLAAIPKIRGNTSTLVAATSMCLSVAPDKVAARVLSKNASSITRSLVELCRTGLIWAIEIFLTWGSFSWLELLGFLVIAIGTMIYGKALTVPYLSYEEEQPILNPYETSKPHPQV